MGLNISICYKGPELFLKGGTILISDFTCCFQKRLQFHPDFTLSPALRVTCKHMEASLFPGTSCHLEGPHLCYSPQLQWPLDFPPSHCNLPSSSMHGMKDLVNSGKEGRVNNILEIWFLG